MYQKSRWFDAGPPQVSLPFAIICCMQGIDRDRVHVTQQVSTPVVGGVGFHTCAACGTPRRNDDLVLVVPRSHRWARRKSVSLEELCNQPFILREAGSGTRRVLEQKLGKSDAASWDRFYVVSQLGSSTAVKEGIRLAGGLDPLLQSS